MKKIQAEAHVNGKYYHYGDKSSAALEAKKAGLKYAGYAKWKNPSTGEIVAKTVNGKLIWLKNMGAVSNQPIKDPQTGKALPSPTPASAVAGLITVPKFNNKVSPKFAQDMINDLMLATYNANGNDFGEDTKIRVSDKATYGLFTLYNSMDQVAGSFDASSGIFSFSPPYSNILQKPYASALSTPTLYKQASALDKVFKELGFTVIADTKDESSNLDPIFQNFYKGLVNSLNSAYGNTNAENIIKLHGNALWAPHPGNKNIPPEFIGVIAPNDKTLYLSEDFVHPPYQNINLNARAKYIENLAKAAKEMGYESTTKEMSPAHVPSEYVSTPQPSTPAPSAKPSPNKLDIPDVQLYKEPPKPIISQKWVRTINRPELLDDILENIEKTSPISAAFIREQHFPNEEIIILDESNVRERTLAHALMASLSSAVNGKNDAEAKKLISELQEKYKKNAEVTSQSQKKFSLWLTNLSGSAYTMYSNYVNSHLTGGHFSASNKKQREKFFKALTAGKFTNGKIPEIDVGLPLERGLTFGSSSVSKFNLNMFIKGMKQGLLSFGGFSANPSIARGFGSTGNPGSLSILLRLKPVDGKLVGYHLTGLSSDEFLKHNHKQNDNGFGLVPADRYEQEKEVLIPETKYKLIKKRKYIYKTSYGTYKVIGVFEIEPIYEFEEPAPTEEPK